MTRDELINAMCIAHNTATNEGKGYISAMGAALSAIEAAGVTLCPNEPTEEMIIQGAYDIDTMDRRFESGKSIAPNVYEKMLSASPLKKGGTNERTC